MLQRRFVGDTRVAHDFRVVGHPQPVTPPKNVSAACDCAESRPGAATPSLRRRCSSTEAETEAGPTLRASLGAWYVGKMRLAVRLETPEDVATIHALNAAAFKTDAEARLVDSPRERRAHAVARCCPRRIVVGHAFSPVTIESDARIIRWIGLAPMAGNAVTSARNRHAVDRGGAPNPACARPTILRRPRPRQLLPSARIRPLSEHLRHSMGAWPRRGILRPGSEVWWSCRRCRRLAFATVQSSTR